MPERIHHDELRCECGRLLARRVSAGIELKCRRCARTITIRLADLSDDAFEPIGRDESMRVGPRDDRRGHVATRERRGPGARSRPASPSSDRA